MLGGAQGGSRRAGQDAPKHLSQQTDPFISGRSAILRRRQKPAVFFLALALGGASRRATGGPWAAPPQALGCRTRRWCPMASVPTLPPCLACASPRIQRCRQEPARTRRYTATRRQRSQRLSTVGTWLDWQAHGWVWCAALLLAPRDRVLTSGSPHLPYRLTQKSHWKRRLESALSKWTSSPLPQL